MATKNKIMSTQQENNDTNFNWLFYALGVVFGLLTAFVVTQDIVITLVGGVLGFLTAGLFLNKIVKGRKY